MTYKASTVEDCKVQIYINSLTVRVNGRTGFLAKLKCHSAFPVETHPVGAGLAPPGRCVLSEFGP